MGLSKLGLSVRYTLVPIGACGLGLEGLDVRMVSDGRLLQVTNARLECVIVVFLLVEVVCLLTEGPLTAREILLEALGLCVVLAGVRKSRRKNKENTAFLASRWTRSRRLSLRSRAA